MGTSEAVAATSRPASKPARAAARPTSGQPAFVLHRYDWSESSVIVELFTRERGRLVVVARGARRPTSNFRPVLLPFHPLQVALGKAARDEQSDIQSLRSAEWRGGHPALPPALMLSGFYVNELLLKLLARQDPHPALFDAYADSLGALALSTAGAADEAATLRAFELLLLRELGLLPDLSHETASAQPLLADGAYTLNRDAGLVPSTAGSPKGAHWLALEAALDHGSPRALRHACTGVAAALRVPLRELLDHHLGTAVLRTREVRQGLQKLTATPVARGA
jgi:DNA repair protein RecO (recombination protein O)